MTYGENKIQNEEEFFLKKFVSREEVRLVTVVKEKAVYLKKETPAVRHLKVQPFYRQYRLASGERTQIVPELKLCGQWLAEAGFEPDSYVSVTVMNGLLVIRCMEVEG